MAKNATLEKPDTQEQAPVQKPANSGYKSAPTPGGNFVKIAIGSSVEGLMVAATMEIEKKKGKKGKIEEKERYHFALALAGDTTLLVGKKKQEKERVFMADEIVVLPDHGYLTSVMRRTACEIGGVPFNDEADTDLKPLVGISFLITRLPDGEISSGQFSGTASALYDVKYKVPTVA